MEIVAVNQKSKTLKPLRRSISFACIFFTFILGLVIGISNYFSYKKSLYQRYQSYIIDILNYVDSKIDHEDLQKCIETKVRSQKYDELEKIMDGIKENFSVHYLYIIKVLNKNPTANVMSVVSAEGYYDRYINTEGNLYLGWISDDEFSVEVVNNFYSAMTKRVPFFFEEATEWGVDYTGALALCDSKRNPYAVLAVDVNITDIKNLIRNHMIVTSVLIIFLGLAFTVLFLIWTRLNILNPIVSLEKCVVAFAEKSHGQRDINLLNFEEPEIRTKNELFNLSKAVTKMTRDIRDYIKEIVEAESKADEMSRQASQMSELANKDALTGIRNKTAYDSAIKNMEYDLSIGKNLAFGIGMIDLNFLKKINDTYGHEKGDISIKKLCGLVCMIFAHSPVFRIGGDEFVVILKGKDFENVESLTDEFNKKIADFAADKYLEPWEKISAALGVAFYDSKIDISVLNVFKRADQKMYERKKAMKATRDS